MFCVYYTGSAVAITFFSLTSGSDVAVTSCLTLGSAVSVIYCVSCIWVVWSSLHFVLFFVCFVLFVCFEAHLCGACGRTTLRYSSEVSRLLHLGRVLCVCPYICVGCNLTVTFCASPECILVSRSCDFFASQTFGTSDFSKKDSVGPVLLFPLLAC